MSKKALVITSIAAPNKVLASCAKMCSENQVEFIVMGDTKSPAQFELEGCKFYSIAAQEKLGFTLADTLPTKHYARKNLGYLEAIRNGNEIIIETDDDNFPMNDFFSFWGEEVSAIQLNNSEHEWVNIYSYFTEKFIWPRGFPLENLQKKVHFTQDSKKIFAPIQQGLADDNPDVDAIYRLTYPLPLKFNAGLKYSLGKNVFTPFNSQNTIWYKRAFALLYLPSYCSFRMTDIWRSYVAQVIAKACDWDILFYSPTVYQERNEHNLLKDFEDEVPGYLNNDAIIKKLNSLALAKGESAIPQNLIKCYQALIEMGVVGEKELPLVEAWLHDIANLR
jgi:hypothetical protein